MRVLLCLLPLLCLSTVAFAQDEAPPPVAPLAPDAEPAPPPAAAAPVDGTEGGGTQEKPRTRGSCWGPLTAGALPCLGIDALGGALLGLGCLFATITPDTQGDNCVESCVAGVVAAGFVVLGIVLGTAALITLGPIAAVVVTVAVGTASALAGRAFWGAALGGVPGVLLGIGGLIVAGLGLSELEVGSRGLEPGLFSGDPRSNLALLGIGMAASAGLVSLLGAVLGDVAFTALLGDEEEPASKRDVSRPGPRELPLALVEETPLYVAY